MIGLYRGEIHVARSGLEYASPALAMAAAQAVNAVNTGQQIGQRVVDAYDDASERVVQGAHTVDHATHESYDATRDGVARGLHATGETVSHGVDAVEHAAQEAGERASDAWDSLTHPGSWFDHKPDASTQTAPALIDHPTHSDHAMYQQAFSGMTKVDAMMGRTSTQQTVQVAGSLVPAAMANGLTRIDEVSLSRDGSRAFAVQQGLLPKLAYVQTDEAVNTSIAQSSAACQNVSQLRVAQQQEAKRQSVQAPEQTQQQHPHHAPSM